MGAYALKDIYRISAADAVKWSSYGSNPPRELFTQKVTRTP
jgi:hypothetical protein